jgi:hypothetical protein
MHPSEVSSASEGQRMRLPRHEHPRPDDPILPLPANFGQPTNQAVLSQVERSENGQACAKVRIIIKPAYDPRQPEKI